MVAVERDLVDVEGGQVGGEPRREPRRLEGRDPGREGREVRGTARCCRWP